MKRVKTIVTALALLATVGCEMKHFEFVAKQAKESNTNVNGKAVLHPTFRIKGGTFLEIGLGDTLAEVSANSRFKPDDGGTTTPDGKLIKQPE